MAAIVSKDTEVLLNGTYGGFGFNREFVAYLISVNYCTEEESHEMISELCGHWSGNFSRLDSIFRKTRTCPILIGHVRAFGLERVSEKYTASIYIQTIPAFYVGTITEVDGYETMEVSFPWETFARALYLRSTGEPVVGDHKMLLDAVENGTLKIPPPED